MIEAGQFNGLMRALCERGFAADIEWSENVQPPASADDFASEAIFVICNSGMHHKAGRSIYERVMPELRAGRSAGGVFGHEGKAAAMDTIWAGRGQLLSDYLASPDPVAFCGSLPWVGSITKYHLAKNFGADVAKPDRHLQRLADAEGTTPAALCARLAAATGLRIATVDLILWRACAIGLIDSKALG